MNSEKSIPETNSFNKEKKSKKKILSWIISLLFVLIGFGLAVLYSNWNMVKNPQDYDVLLPEDQIELVNWASEGGKLITGEDPQIIIPNLNKQVNDILLEGSFNGDFSQTKVYFTTSSSPDFSEENSFVVNAKETSKGILLPISKSVTSLRIDLTEDAGATWSGGDNVIINPKNVQFQIQVIALFALIGALVSIPLHYDRSALSKGWLYLKNAKNYSYLLQNLVRKDITTKYRRSVLGVLWSVLNPLLMMLVITMVFQHVFRSDIENFPIYYLTGSLLFNFVVEATNSSMMSILQAAPLIKKVYIPKYIFPIEKTVFALVNMLFSLIAVIIIMVIQRFTPSWTILLFPIPIFYVFIFTLGLGLILSALNVFFRDISHLWGVFTTAWMYLTPIIYPMTMLPDSVQNFVKLNPLYYYVDYFRQVVMYGTVPNLTTNAVCLFLSLAFLVFGILIFKKSQDKFILHI